MNSIAFFLAENASSGAIRDIDVSTVAGKLDMGIRVLFLGMLIVFSVLATLWLCLALFKFVFHDLLPNLKNKNNVPTVIESAPVRSEDEEIVAAITAAIAAASASADNAPPPRFRVVSFRRIS